MLTNIPPTSNTHTVVWRPNYASRRSQTVSLAPTVQLLRDGDFGECCQQEAILELGLTLEEGIHVILMGP